MINFQTCYKGVGEGKTAWLKSKVIDNLNKNIVYVGNPRKFTKFCENWIEDYKTRCPVEFMERTDALYSADILITDGLLSQIDCLPILAIRHLNDQEETVTWYMTIEKSEK